MKSLLYSFFTIICLGFSVSCITRTEGAETSFTEVDSTKSGTNSKEPFQWSSGSTVELLSSTDSLRINLFEPLELSDSIFNVISGSTFNAHTPVSRDELRYLRIVHYDFDGNIRMGEIICNRDIANDLAEIFSTLYDARYPLERVLLADAFGGDDEASMTANNTSCFNTRGIGGGKQLSKHSSGMAIDLNPLYNPLVKVRRGKRIVEPSSAQAYTNRADSFPGKIDNDDLAYRLFRSHGFRWGGAWKTVKDYQHFEK